MLRTAFEKLAPLNHQVFERYRDAFVDTTTELPNGTGIQHYIASWRNKGRQLAAEGKGVVPGLYFYGDLAFLKEVNDTFGHSNGTLLIISTANALTEFYKKAYPIYAARPHGDEFEIFLPNAKREDAKDIVVQLQLYLQINRPTVLSAHHKKTFKLPLALSMGWESMTIFDDYEEVKQRAEKHMYKHKANDHIKLYTEFPELRSRRTGSIVLGE